MNRTNSLAYRVARWLTMFGSLVLIAMITATCLSIAGRSLNTLGNTAFVGAWLPGVSKILVAFAPIAGDFELVEMGMALAIFSFLPWCQLNRGHASVDILTTKFLPRHIELWLLVFWEVALSIVIGLLTWRLYAGLRDKMAVGEVTFLLQWPIWWAYAACFVVGAIASLVGVFAVVDRFRDATHVNTLSRSAGNE